MYKEIVQSLTDAGSVRLKRKIGSMYALLTGVTIGVWIVAFMLFASRPHMLALCLLAWIFGLKHAVDADHIAAVDNVTRKLMNDGQRPVGVGFYFSLGHSLVVILLSVGIVFGVQYVHSHHSLGTLADYGAIIGTIVSGGFLFLIGTINFLVFLNIYHGYKKIKQEGQVDEQAMESHMENRGLLTRILRPLLKMITSSWQMFPVGFLFGLGFDTATEVGLLGISAAEAAKGMPVWFIMVFPVLFTAGMCMIDTTDGILMQGAYGWALLEPTRKLFYNGFITLLGFLVAFFIGGIEILGVIGQELHISGAGWNFINVLNDHFGAIGYGLIAIFMTCWLTAAYMYKQARQAVAVNQ
ncbi:MAG: HoxN/HupN/NixA family nickel/cobalt transporter [Syntrophobacteraceae bacterium]